MVFPNESPIDDKAELVQLMSWHLTGDKPLPEPVLTLWYSLELWAPN